MTRNVPCFLAFLLLLPAAVPAFNMGDAGELSLGYDARFYTQSIGGNAAQSFLKEGAWNVQDLSAGYKRRDGDFIFETSASGYSTTDVLVNREAAFQFRRWSVLAGNQGPDLEATLRGGDLYTDFSRYTLSQPLRGAQGTLKTGGLSFIPVGGRVWEAKDGQQYQRNAYGARLEQEFMRGISAGANWVWAADDAASMKNDASLFAQEKNQVVSGDLKFQVTPLFGLEGEFASSGYENAKALTKSSDTATAVFGRATSRLGFLRLAAEAEQVQPRFASIVGTAAPDRLRYYGRAEASLWDAGRLTGFYETFRNNLDGSQSRTETCVIPGGTLGWRPVRELELETGYKVRTIRSDDSPVTVDRLSTTLHGGLTGRAWNSSLSASVQKVQNRDRVDAGSETDILAFDTSLRSTVRALENVLDVSPLLSLGGSADTQLATGKQDSGTHAAAGLTLTLYRDLDLNGRGQTSRAVRQTAGKNTERQHLQAGAVYRILGMTDNTAGFTFSRLTLTAPDSADDYSETKAETFVSLRF